MKTTSFFITLAHFVVQAQHARKLLTGSALCVGLLGGSAFADTPAAGNLTVHEWGTFTSLQAGDGAPMHWKPLNVSPLPGFVYNWKHPGFDRFPTSMFGGGKGAVTTVQRMETPVIYFYTDKEQTVDLTVRFPQGLVTEWYPQAREIGPSVTRVPDTGKIVGEQISQSKIHWPMFQVTPTSPHSTAPLLQDARGSHYFAARETDSALLRFNFTTPTNSTTETEKFLFYRGVGDFSTPLRASISSSDAVTIANTSKENLDDLFVLAVHDGKGKFIHVPSLKAGEEKTVPTDLSIGSQPVKALSQYIAQAMASALQKQKLFPREASAMVKTWEDSWFQEEGVRVLYVLPRAWTDATLPLDMKPAPSDLVRVMVGRAELVSPRVEENLAAQLAPAKRADATAKQQTESTLQQLGRFAEPILLRAFEKAKCTPGQRTLWYSWLYENWKKHSATRALAQK